MEFCWNDVMMKLCNEGIWYCWVKFNLNCGIISIQG